LVSGPGKLNTPFVVIEAVVAGTVIPLNVFSSVEEHGTIRITEQEGSKMSTIGTNSASTGNAMIDGHLVEPSKICQASE
jgi:hypothetical protein